MYGSSTKKTFGETWYPHTQTGEKDVKLAMRNSINLMLSYAIKQEIRRSHIDCAYRRVKISPRYLKNRNWPFTIGGDHCSATALEAYDPVF